MGLRRYLRRLGEPLPVIPYEPVGPEALEHDARARSWVRSGEWYRPLVLTVFTVFRLGEVVYRTGSAGQVLENGKIAFWFPDHPMDFLREGDLVTVRDEYGRSLAVGHARLHSGVPAWITFDDRQPPWESADLHDRAAVESMRAGAVSKYVRGPGRWPHVMHYAMRQRSRDAALANGEPDPEPHWADPREVT